MSNSRLVYRSRQFWKAIRTDSSREDMEQVSAVLTPSQYELFQQMHKSEQAHSLRVLRKLKDQGEQNADLQTAALLHDVGKIRLPLQLWERVLVVLVRALCADCVKKWGSVDERVSLEELGWHKAFVVAEKHPVWGAELAAQVGASEVAVALIARHQEQLPPMGDNKVSVEDRLLSKLQAVDNQS
jgi:putative nucleotidyltransferase with HDIG domain